ncbi:MFS transporter [Maritimibacter sp. 55A14]|uniref:class I SAM-dependent methyltransferase n=1 Tax=Maritimibacter sp. 55A14 TaxID=2174844 RepID=UPI000D60C5E3|nr:class I SAM-dependent methyltransferase [Maritimibacter sp. 55A14]PWE31306.1 MFS transporter [Maritimibacter sp. 55A14]
MTASRISLAVETGTFPVPPAGRIAALRVRPDHDLSALPAERLHVVQGFRPHFDALARRFDCAVAPEGPYAAALVAATRSKPQTLGLIATALHLVPADAPIAVDGQKTDGIDSLLKTCKRALGETAVVAKAHGKLFVLTRPAALPGAVADWATAAAPTAGADGAVTQAGVFSAGRLDAGSALLAECLPQSLKGLVADLGAGWGALAPAVLAHPGVTGLDLVEGEHDALEAARRNVSDARARFLWEDVAGWRTGATYDWVISNPPFHQGRAADPGLGQAFIRTAAAVLRPGGRFLMVANRQLPYERTLAECFSELATLRETPAFKILQAGRPKSASRAGAGKPVSSPRGHKAGA